MAADKIDPLASPAGDGAIMNGELVEARTLDAVVIPPGPNVADVDSFECDASGGIRLITSIIEIESVASLSADAQVSQG